MIKIYENGADFLKDNYDYLLENEDMSSFFLIDAPLLLTTNQKNYAIKCFNDDLMLLALKVEPYVLLLYGDKKCSKELVNYLLSNNYSVSNYMCEHELGLEFMAELKQKDLTFEPKLMMDFLETTKITEKSDSNVLIAIENDLDEICECLEKFIVDCGTSSIVDKEKVLQQIKQYRLIKINNEIASMAKISPSTSKSLKISCVYTRDKYRGKHLARKVVNYCKNEIIKQGLIATLNVDQKNPISYHLYDSLGFKKAFAQTEFHQKYVI